MWIAIIGVALLFGAMLFLAPKPNVENAKAAKFGDLSVPRSNYGDPISMLWGTDRQKSPVVIWYGDFKAVPIIKKIDGGWFSSDTSYVAGHKYYLGFDLALCLGPNVVLHKIWSNDDLIWEGTQSTDGDITINKPDLFGGSSSGGGLSGTVSFYTGSFSTARDSYLAEKVDANVPAYNGICRAVFKGFYIGNSSGSLPSLSFELSRRTTNLHSTYSLMPNGFDLNPIEICYDVFTRRFGCFGNSSSVLNIASFISSAQTVYNENIEMSLLIQSSVSGEDILKEIMTQCDGLLYEDPTSSEIYCKLIREDYLIGDLLILDESNISELTNFQKTTWADTFNQVRVTFSNREDDYDDSVAVAQDFANVNFQDRVVSTDISGIGCKTSSTALKLAAKQISYINIPFYKCEITCNRKAQSLRPGDCFVLNWPSFNLTNMVMRVSKIDLGELVDNKITITCVQDKYSSQLPIFAEPEISQFIPINSDPSTVTYSSVFTPPLFLSSTSDTENVTTFDNNGRLYCVAKKPTGASFLYDGMISSDNFVAHSTVGKESIPYNATGKLLNAYLNTVASETRYDTSSSLIVYDLTNEDISLLKNYTTLDQARNGSALILIGSELMIYVGFTNNGDGSVTFPKVYRSIYDTTIQSHSADARVWFIDGKAGLLSQLISDSTLKYVKLLDTTLSGKLELADATTITATQNGRAGLPLPTNYLTLNGSRTPITTVGATSIAVAWRNRDRNDTTLKVYNDSGSVREAGTQTRIRYALNGADYTTLTTTVDTATIPVTGLNGSLEVLTDQQIISNSKYSSVVESLNISLLYQATVFLCNFNGTNGSTTFTEETGKTITRYGNAVISTAQYKFGGASGYFDGSGDVLSSPNSSDFYFATGSFTIEAWVRPSTISSVRAVCSQRSSDYRGWVLMVSATGALQFAVTNTDIYNWVNILSASSLSVNEWAHVAASFDGVTLRLFINGTQCASTSIFNGTPTNGSGPFYVGRDRDTDTTRDWQGYIDDLRITKGLARYTADFTPPTSQLTTALT